MNFTPCINARVRTDQAGLYRITDMVPPLKPKTTYYNPYTIRTKS